MRLVIPGAPVAKQRARRGKGGHWFTPAATRQYEELVAWYCRAAGERLGSSSVAVTIALWSERPLRGDLDNYAKAILDGMVKGGLIDDDRQVAAFAVAGVVGGELEQAVVDVRVLDGARPMETDARSSSRRERPGSSIEHCPYCAPDEPCALHLPNE